MKIIEIRRRLKALGYRLQRRYYCPIRRCVFPYATLPDSMPGTTCVHENLGSVEARIHGAENVRAWQRGAIEAAEKIEAENETKESRR